MKTLVVVASGAADRPLEELGARTPLEAAATPALDRIARDGRLGRLVPAPKGVRPEEAAFVLGLFGLDPLSYGDIGSALDAAAFDIEVGPRDQVFRLALVTADSDTLFDPTAGSISADEARLLLASLQESLADTDLELHAGDGVHNVLLWRGARDVAVRTHPPYEVVGKKLRAALPRGSAARPLLEAIQRSAEVLPAHEVNELRRDLGENSATMVWPWAPGVSIPLPDFTARTGVRAAAVGTEPAFVGAARLQGIARRTPAGATGPSEPGVRAFTATALAALQEHDLVFLHTDVLARASHARDQVSKIEALERLDGYALGAVLRALDEGLEARVAVLGGPAVSTETGRYLPDPVPFAIHGPGVRGQRRGAFTEVSARAAGFQVDHVHELLDFLLHLPE